MRLLSFVVLGEPFQTEWDADAPVFAVRWHVLLATANTGRPPAEFDLYSRDGQYIDPLTLVKDLPEGEIFLSPCMGMGGSHTNYRRKLVPPVMNGQLWVGNTMKGRNGTRWNTGAHAKTQLVNRRMEARSDRRNQKIQLAQGAQDV